MLRSGTVGLRKRLSRGFAPMNADQNKDRSKNRNPSALLYSISFFLLIRVHRGANPPANEFIDAVGPRVLPSCTAFPRPLAARPRMQSAVPANRLRHRGRPRSPVSTNTFVPSSRSPGQAPSTVPRGGSWPSALHHHCRPDSTNSDPATVRSGTPRREGPGSANSVADETRRPAARPSGPAHEPAAGLGETTRSGLPSALASPVLVGEGRHRLLAPGGRRSSPPYHSRCPPSALAAVATSIAVLPAPDHQHPPADPRHSVNGFTCVWKMKSSASQTPGQLSSPSIAQRQRVA